MNNNIVHPKQKLLYGTIAESREPGKLYSNYLKNFSFVLENKQISHNISSLVSSTFFAMNCRHVTAKIQAIEI